MGPDEKIDFNKISDVELSLLFLRRNVLQSEIELIDELLNKVGEAKGLADAAKKETAKIEETTLPGVDLSKLPWKSYKTKQDAESNEAAWIFSNTAGAEALLATLKSKNGKTRIGNFAYQLQGDQKQFISRKPVKDKK